MCNRYVHSLKDKQQCIIFNVVLFGGLSVNRQQSFSDKPQQRVHILPYQPMKLSIMILLLNWYSF